MKTVRTNLTLPAPVDQVLLDIAHITGQSKSSAIAAYLTMQLPDLCRWIERYRETQGGSSSSSLPKALVKRDVERGPGSFRTPELRQEALTRQQARALKRQEAKEETRLAKQQIHKGRA